jgi:DNA replication protein DnaC
VTATRIVIPEVLTQDSQQVPVIEHDHVVQTLPSEGADEPLSAAVARGEAFGSPRPKRPPPAKDDLATCRFIERHENVFFVGPAGVGKSHLAQALGHEACRRGDDVLFMPAARALAQLAAGRADGTYERRLAGFARAHLLILDDLGLKPLRPPAPEDLYEVVAERYEKGSMIVTSNRAFAEWPELFGEQKAGNEARAVG